MDYLTADLVDDHQANLQSCNIAFQQYGAKKRFAGPIVTVKTYEDNLTIRQLVGQPGDGRVLVVDGGGSTRSALMGDNLAEAATKNGWAGVVIWGAVRDVAQLAKLDIGIKALASNPWRSTNKGGEQDVQVSFGGVDFQPGFWLYSDEDGIVVSKTAL